MFYLVKTPFLLKKLYPQCIWNIDTQQNELYLTFDDGPNNIVTPFVLNELGKYHARATFFCIGKNVHENFKIYEQTLNEGHSVGNHTFNHLNGWKTPDEEYLEDVDEAATIIDSKIFRPPYGKITRFQLKALQGERFQFKTIMWDVLSGDFDTSISGENCYLNVVNNVKQGSIIVFHDSIKAMERLQYSLPRVLKYFVEKGFQFKPLI